jgi:hypothetical protein
LPSRKKYDAFICHASEDKKKVARPLAEQLESHGLKIWYDEFSLHTGDSLSEKIDEGLTYSKHGIIIVSKNFFKKRWPKKEYYALMNRHVNSNKRIILPIRHSISTKEIQRYSAELADAVALKTNEGIKNIAEKLYREIVGIRTVYNFKSGTELSPTLSALSRSMQERKSLVEEEKEEMIFVILTRIYLIAKGYRISYIPYHPFSVSLSSSREEIMRRIEECIKALIRKKFIISKSLGTISITHKGIKKIENLLEETSQEKSSTSKKIASQIKHSIDKSEKSKILEIQRLRYDILKRSSGSSKQKDKVMNIFTMGAPLGIEREKLERIYLYLQDEGLIESYALGGSFYITTKGLQRVKKSPKRIF